jgi:hypothetical protein
VELIQIPIKDFLSREETKKLVLIAWEYILRFFAFNYPATFLYKSAGTLINSIIRTMIAL